MRPADERGVAMIEATIGTVLLLFAAMTTIQLVLVFHGALAAHGAAARAARTLAVTGSSAMAEQVYQQQTSTSLRALRWQGVSCVKETRRALCTVTVEVPAILPGGGLFGGGGLTGHIPLHETGVYPIGGDSGG